MYTITDVIILEKGCEIQEVNYVLALHRKLYHCIMEEARLHAFFRTLSAFLFQVPRESKVEEKGRRYWFRPLRERDQKTDRSVLRVRCQPRRRSRGCILGRRIPGDFFSTLGRTNQRLAAQEVPRTGRYLKLRGPPLHEFTSGRPRVRLLLDADLFQRHLLFAKRSVSVASVNATAT